MLLAQNYKLRDIKKVIKSYNSDLENNSHKLKINSLIIDDLDIEPFENNEHR